MSAEGEKVVSRKKWWWWWWCVCVWLTWLYGKSFSSERTLLSPFSSK